MAANGSIRDRLSAPAADPAAAAVATAAAADTSLTAVFTVDDDVSIDDSEGEIDSTNDMGCQSQLRNGSIQTMKKKGAGRKKKKRSLLTQMTIRGLRAFSSIVDCAVCKAKNLNLRVPHRPHDKRCPLNQKTKGFLSSQSVFVEEEAERNLRLNNAPMENLFIPGTTAEQKYNLLFTQSLMARAESSEEKKQEDPSPFDADMSKGVALGTSLAAELKRRLARANEYSWLDEKLNAPKPIGLLVHFMQERIAHRTAGRNKNGQNPTPNFLKAVRNAHDFFEPGTCQFVIPPDFSDTACPEYDSIVGDSIVYVDWEFTHPDVSLRCFECEMKKKNDEQPSSTLQRERQNFGNNKTLHPIWTTSGRPMWVFGSCYSCPCCSTKYNAWDGRLLMMLPASVRQVYPVEPRYAIDNSFHLHRDVSDYLEMFVTTYGNAKQLSEFLYKQSGKLFTRRLEAYLSKGGAKDSFPSYEDWSAGKLPPSPDLVREAFYNAERSYLTPYGHSHYERYNRELQSVSVGLRDTLAIDWTFAVIKCYFGIAAKCAFTCMKGSTKEIVLVGLVASTAVNQISHMMNRARRLRKEFTPAALYTDTCPANKSFWQGVFGSGLEMRLGLFHLMHRVYGALNEKCDLFMEAIAELKKAIYFYNDSDYKALTKNLRNGKLSKDGATLTDTQIDELRQSKRWKERYSRFLRKKIRATNEVRTKLDIWTAWVKGQVDDKGDPLVQNSQKMDDIIKDQKNIAMYLQDPIGIEMYQEIKPGPRASKTHGMSTWKSLRPESFLEYFHQLLAHFANTGMNKKLADTITMRGTAEYNVSARFRTAVERGEIDRDDVPWHFKHIDIFQDHTLLNWLNETAKAKGMDEPFKRVTPVAKQNNGEVFFSEYFDEQEERSKAGLIGDDGCECRLCSSPAQPTDSNAPGVVQEPTQRKRTQVAVMPPPGEDLTVCHETQTSNKKQRVTPLEAPAETVGRISAENVPLQYSYMQPLQPVQLALLQPLYQYQCLPISFGTPSFCCEPKFEYDKRRAAGEVILGRPPHSQSCPLKGGIGLF